MKAFLECIPCIIRQSIEVAKMVTTDRTKQKEILLEVMKAIRRIPVTEMTPPEATEAVHEVIKTITGIPDLYAAVKKENNKLALGLYPRMKKIVRSSANPLLAAVRLAIAGNVIDYGVHSGFDVEATIEEVLKKDFAVNHYDRFKSDLKKAKKILYIGDNAGEIVFDKVLIEEFPKNIKVTYAVKSRPTLNDVMMEDAKSVKMDDVSEVIESGSSCPGTFVHKGTKQFIEAYKKADMVIAKGQGNYETLEDPKKEIFLLLKAKCPYLAEEMGLKKGDIVLLCRKG